VLATIHVCEVCHDLFPTQSAVRQHLHVCHPKLEFRVESLTVEKLLATVKSAKGSTQVGSTEHIRISGLEGSFCCRHQGCQFICPTAHELKLHSQLHRETRIYVCDHCGRCCGGKGPLTNHMVRSHFPVKKPVIFECKFCGKKFRSQIANSEHMLTHVASGSGVFKCNHIGCKRSFVSLVDLEVYVVVRKKRTVSKTVSAKTLMPNKPG